MNVLVCDTSSQALTVGLFTDGFKEVRTIGGRTVQHSERLVPTVVELCNDAGLDTKDIDLLVCTRGPGSFTGLRIGMAAFKGMAFALGKPIVSVSTLEAYASCVGAFDGAIVPVIDAKKKRWYLAAFETRPTTSQPGASQSKASRAGTSQPNASKSGASQSGVLQSGASQSDTECGLLRIVPDTDGTEADLAEALAPYERILVTGPDAIAFKEVLSMAEPFKDKSVFVDTKANEAIATALYELGTKQFKEKGTDDVGQGPVYLRKSDAEIALDEKLAKEAGR